MQHAQQHALVENHVGELSLAVGLPCARRALLCMHDRSPRGVMALRVALLGSRAPRPMVATERYHERGRGTLVVRIRQQVSVCCTELRRRRTTGVGSGPW